MLDWLRRRRERRAFDVASAYLAAYGPEAETRFADDLLYPLVRSSDSVNARALAMIPLLRNGTGGTSIERELAALAAAVEECENG